MLLINPVRGDIIVVDGDPAGHFALGYREATPDELERSARVEEYGSFEQQAQAQGERVLRGLTFGGVEGFGEPEDIRARAEVSEELSPITSLAANILPDVGVAVATGGLGGLATGAGRLAAREALASGAGLVRAGLAAGRAGGAAALAAESVGTGLVGAGQSAYAEGRDFVDDPGKFAEDALIWGGLNFGLGAFMMRGGKQAERELLEEGAEGASKELDDIAAAAEVRETAKGFDETIGAPGETIPASAETTAPGMRWEQTAPAESVDEFVARQEAERGVSAGQVAGAAALGGAAVLGAEGETEGSAGAAAGGLALLLGRRGLGLKRPLEETIDLVSKHTDEAVQSLTDAERHAITNWSNSSRHTKSAFEGIQRTPEENAAKLRKLGYDEKQITRANERAFATKEQEAIKMRESGYAESDIEQLLSDYEPGFANADDRQLVKDMTGAMQKLSIDNPTQHGPLLRGFAAGDEMYEMPGIEDVLTKNTFVNKTPISTSYNVDAVGDFASGAFNKQGTAPVFLVFEKVNKASPRMHPAIQSLSEEARLREAEVIIPPGSTFRVLGREKTDLHMYPEGHKYHRPQDKMEATVVRLEQIADAPREAWKDAAMIGAILGGGGAAAAGEEESGAAAAGAGALGLLLGRRGLGFGRKLQAAAVRRGEREAVEGGVERALRNASKSDAADVVERALGPEPVKEADSFGRQRRLYINRKAIRQVAAKEMQKDLSELVENVRQVSSVEKQAAVAARVSDNLPAQRAVAKGVAEDAAKFAGELRAEAKAYGAAAGKKGLQYAIPGQRDLGIALMDHAKEIAKATDGKALFEALDSFKRAAQEHKLSLESGMANSESALHYEKLIPRVEQFASRIRAALEDSTTWGRAGEAQRAYNAVISDRLIPHMKTFESAVLKRTHKGYDGLWKTEGWEGKIASLLKDADGGNRRHVVAALDAMDELAGVARKFGDAKQADAISTQVSKVRRTLGLADELADAEERMHALGQIIGGGPMGGAFAGALMGGLPGAAIGAALPGAVRGFVMGDLIEAFQRLSGATDAAVKRGVDDWIRSSRVRSGGIRERLPKLPKLSEEAKQLRDVAARRGITQSMALFMGEDSTPHAAYRRLQDSLLDGEKFFADVTKDYGTLQSEAPEVFMTLAARAEGDRQFLLQRMPPNVAVSMANPEGYPPSRDSIEDWATYVNAIRYPMRVASSIGSMRVQEAEALRERRPRVYELLQQRVIEGIQEARRSGTQLDDVTLAKINLLFPEVDGLASPVFSRELGQVVVDFNLAKRERERGGGSPSTQLDKRGQLPAQAMAQQGATFGMRG